MSDGTDVVMLESDCLMHKVNVFGVEEGNIRL